AYLFEQSNDVWNQTFKILHTPGGAFGQSVASLGNQVFMGGFQYDGPFKDLKESIVIDAGAVAVCPTGVPQPARPICVKTGPASVEAGELAAYTVIVSNTGVAAATGVILNDPTPAGLTFVRADKPCDKGFPCSLGTIAGGVSLPPVKVTFQIADECSAPNSITNIATVTGDGVDAFKCTPTFPTTVLRPPPGPLVSCDKLGPDSAMPGDIVTYNITVSNFGCGAAKNVTLSDPAPAGLSLVSVSGPCTQLPCNLGTIGRDQTLPPVKATFHVDVPLDCSGSAQTVENVATVGDAECSAQTRIVPPQADLALMVSNVVPPAAACGTSFSFSVNASNLGPAVARGAVVDVTAAGAVSLTTSESGCALVPGPQPHLRCTGLPDLAPGGPGHTITFSVQAPACGPGCAAVTINATVQSGNTCDPSSQNDTVIQVVPVNCSPVADLAITKIHEPAVLAPGQAMAYVLTVRNNGPSDVPGTTVTDSLPSALLAPHCVGPNRLDCTFLGNNLNIAVGPLPKGSEVIYRIEGQLTSQCITTLTNIATVSPAPGIVDPDLSNNTATDTTAIQSPPGVSIHCSGVSGAFEGDFVTFTYVLSNGGPNAQADNPGAEFTDTLPAGLTLVTATASSGTVTTAANTVSWNGSIPICGTVTINVQATVNAGTAGMTLCNQGNVFFDADGDGIDESNASASCCLKVSTTPPPPPIPTLQPAGLAALMILLACVALLRLRRRPL
ncbi:MAG TPA: hypothetical protein VGQ28_10770, partial [Thermoanaerobaculia bacterium]|nr:hypothetical protein [Thermoanaerobaculia bacterium]